MAKKRNHRRNTIAKFIKEYNLDTTYSMLLTFIKKEIDNINKNTVIIDIIKNDKIESVKYNIIDKEKLLSFLIKNY